MASRFTRQAQSQLNPGYNQQISAVQSQIPAIQNLYQSYIQGLQAQQPMQNLGVLEDASGRGILRSTIPAYGQQQVAQNILQQTGQYSAQQQKELGDIYGQVAGIRTEKAKSIADLANALYGTDIQNRTLQNTIGQGNRQFTLQQQTAAQNHALQMQLANRRY